MMNHPNTNTLPFALTNCGQCGVDARPFLHHIHHHGLFRRLCTACLLRGNSHAFCPTCFALHDPRAAARALENSTPCTQCGSVSHSVCVGENPSKETYICPLCTAQFSPIFGWKSGNQGGEIDRKSAAALLAAAKISYDSMSKAASVAKLEADKRVKEANFTRKRAKEALDHVAFVSEKLETDGNLRNGGIMGFGGNVNVVGERNLFDRVDNSTAVLAAFNAVDLREKVKQDGGVSGNGILGVGLVPLGVGGNGNGNGSSNGNGREMVQVVDARPISVVGQFVQNGHPREGNRGPFQ